MSSNKLKCQIHVPFDALAFLSTLNIMLYGSDSEVAFYQVKDLYGYA